MQQLVLLALLGASLILAEDLLERSGKSLVNTFPFNAAELDHHHGGHHRHIEHSGNHGARTDFGSADLSVLRRDERQRQRQRAQPIPSVTNTPILTEVANARPDNDGKRCIDKVEMVEEIEYEDHIQCDHSYDKRCHTTYVTNYESQQEEECEENYRKNCFIDYEQIAFNETVKVCRTGLVKNCTVRGPEICRTEYESECWTKPEKHEVVDDIVSCKTEYEEICKSETNGYTTIPKCTKWPHQVCTLSREANIKVTPVVGCHKVPIELCAPAGCKLVPEPEPHCHDEIKTIVQDKPKEECSLEPQRTCKHVTKLVPKLSPTEECVDVPKEVCTRSRTNPRKVKKPVVKKWCYVPSEESGLA